ncbi:hypothetical protein V1291_002006 [Nitrobacteraceae bacterium AZCC 1564]
MRTTGLAILAAACVLAVSGTARAGTDLFSWVDTVPPFKGNDTGGIISYSLYQQGVDIRALAVDHCAHYGKGVKLISSDARYGGYISFSCVWVRPGHLSRPLRVAY